MAQKNVSTITRQSGLTPILIAALALLAPLPGIGGVATVLEPVTLQLKWTHAFQFAGYYAAKELGYYREAGLDVTFQEARPGDDIVRKVLSGNAELGVGSSSLLLDRNAGQPVVVLAVIFQHSPLVLIAGNPDVHQTIHDLAGKRVMMEPLSDELLAYLKREGISPDRLETLEHSFSIRNLLDGKIEAISAYSSYEPFLLQQVGFRYRIFYPLSSGIDFYGDNLFTSERQLRQHPERVKAFRAASLRGWRYAMAHPEELIELIQRKYSEKLSREFLRFEATQIAKLIKTPLVDIGYMYPGRWRHIADVYAELGMLPADFSLDGFLYDPNPETDLGRLYRILAIALAFAGVTGGIAGYIYHLNRRLKKNLAKVQVLSTAVEQSPTSIVITGPDTVIQYVNPYFSTETGYSAAEVLGKTPKILGSGLTDPTVYQEMWNSLRSGNPWTGEFANRRKSGEVYWEEARIAPVKSGNGKINHYVAVKLNITERKRAHERLTHLAFHDVLTDLPNRALFFDRVANGLALAKRNQTRLALMLVDLDKFKPINDIYGHAAGDLVLREAARRMSVCVRASDVVGRVGGDEFVVLLNDVGSEQNAVMVAAKIRGALDHPFSINDKTLSISSSIGVALYPDHAQNDIELAANADAAMYRAKASGRNRVVVFAPGMAGASP